MRAAFFDLDRTVLRIDTGMSGMDAVHGLARLPSVRRLIELAVEEDLGRGRRGHDPWPVRGRDPHWITPPFLACALRAS